MRPDPALSTSDFADELPKQGSRRGTVVWAVIFAAGLFVWFGLKLAEKHGVGWTGPSQPMALIDQTPYHLSVNDADWPEFMQLPGIGETLARRIVEDRAENGPFASVEELQRVRGIGPATLAKMRPSLVIDAGTQLAFQSDD